MCLRNVILTMIAIFSPVKTEVWNSETTWKNNNKLNEVTIKNENPDVSNDVPINEIVVVDPSTPSNNDNPKKRKRRRSFLKKDEVKSSRSRRSVTKTKSEPITEIVPSPYKCPVCKKDHTKKNLDKVAPNSHVAIAARCMVYEDDVFIFRCDTCPKVFRCQDYFSKHYNIHLRDPSEMVVTLKCSLCGKKHSKRNVDKMSPDEPLAIASRCMMIDGENFTFNCDQCNKVYNCQDPFLRHYSVHEAGAGPDDEKYQCPVCKRDHSKKNLDKVSPDSVVAVAARCMVKEDGVFIFKCDKCPKVFPCQDYFSKHYVKHAEEPLQEVRGNYKCPVCKRDHSLKDPEKLSPESRVAIAARCMSYEDGVYVFKCDACPRVFPCQEYFSKHYSIHLKDPIDKPITMKCRICRRHHSKRNVDHLPSDNPVAIASRCMVIENESFSFKCDQCEKVFLCQDYFRRHYSTHSGKLSYCCHICGKQFRISNLLRVHLEGTHATVKNHACRFCGKRFTSKAKVDGHLVVHSNERPWVCEECGGTYKCRNSLRIHKRITHGEARYKCKLCPMKYKSIEPLRSHERTHTGERPFVCETCGKSFSSKEVLKKHYTVHSDERKFSCNLCGAKFKIRQYLVQHMRTHKPKVKDTRVS